MPDENGRFGRRASIRGPGGGLWAAWGWDARDVARPAVSKNGCEWKGSLALALAPRTLCIRCTHGDTRAFGLRSQTGTFLRRGKSSRGLHGLLSDFARLRFWIRAPVADLHKDSGRIQYSVFRANEQYPIVFSHGTDSIWPGLPRQG